MREEDFKAWEPLLMTSSYSHSHFGHDKSLSITPYRELPNPPLLFFAGDGM
jgi:2-hydroxy-3-keto-5-methylthiopentenyl-1-phosphate phosphatase